MFTGLIKNVGQLISLKKINTGAVMTISHDKKDWSLLQGESIAVQGACLTASQCAADYFVCDVLDETIMRTNLTSKRSGSLLNLERALCVGDRMGGHIVTGHVDGVGTVLEKRKAGRDWALKINCGKDLAFGIVEKGSVACDGVSLTVTAVNNNSFEVNIIPFTMEHTSLANLASGDTVNIETDIFGKYVHRYMNTDSTDSELDMRTLKNAGFL